MQYKKSNKLIKTIKIFLINITNIYNYIINLPHGVLGFWDMNSWAEQSYTMNILAMGDLCWLILFLLV